MFIIETSQVARPFDRLAAHFVEPDWLHPLAIAAAAETLDSIHNRPIHNRPTDDTARPAISNWHDELRYELAPIRVGAHEIAVAMRWHSGLSPEVFPERFDGDLRIERADTTHSDLTVVGTYPRSKLLSVEPLTLLHATELWARLFLANIIRAIPAMHPSDRPVTRGKPHGQRMSRFAEGGTRWRIQH